MRSLVPAAVIIAAAVFVAHRLRARRRFEKLVVSGGRKAFILNLRERGR